MDSESKHIFTWTIENFKACTQKNGFCLESPTFLVEDLYKTTWMLKLYPRGDKGTRKNFMSCFLRRSNNCEGPEVIDWDYTLEATDGKNESLVKKRFICKFKKGASLGSANFLGRDTNFKKISCDTFTIKVTVRKILPNMLTKSSGWTKIATDMFSFEWKVRNSFSSYSDNKPVSFSEKLKFDVMVEIPEDDIEISIRIKKGFAESEILICKVILLDLKGEETDSKETVFEADEPDGTGIWKFPNFLKKSEINAKQTKFLQEDHFTLKFDFTLSNGKTSVSMNCTESKPLADSSKADEDQHTASLKADLKRVLTNQAHTDVELHADKKLIRDHKVILCARSPVFSAMFDQDMAEKQTSVIKISDVEAETLNSLLEYMYSGEIGILNCESILKLLLAADKYQVLPLKEKCSSTLSSLVSEENVCDILLTADLIQLESLKVCAVNHIKQKSKTIFKSDEWKQLAVKNLELATETFCEVSTLLSG